MQEVAKRLATTLGVSDRVDVEARLSKLALYDEDNSLALETNDEGSLVIQLPCEHQGGALVVRHDEDEERFDDPSLGSYEAVAFWTDTEYEIEPVTSGARVCLLYDLRVRTGPMPRMNDFGAFQRKLAALADTWDAKRKIVIKPDDTGTKMPRFDDLEYRDPDVVEALLNSNKFEVYLARVTKHVSGAPELNYDEYGEPDNGKDSDMGEIYETSMKVTHWISVPDNIDVTKRYKRVYIDFDDDLLHLDYIVHDDDDDSDDDDSDNGGSLFDDDDEPNERKYMRNGANLDFYYHKTVAIVWPKESDQDRPEKRQRRGDDLIDLTSDD